MGCLLLIFFSCVHDGIRSSHVKIESGKNSKTKYIHAHYRKLYPTLPGWPTHACSYEKYSSHLGGILEKSIEIPLRRAGSLLI